MTIRDAPTLDFDAIARKEQKAARPKVLTFTVAAVLAVAWLTPFYYLMISVFKSNTEYGNGNPLALPQSWEPVLVNVTEAWTKTRMADGMLNSALYGLLGAGTAMFIAALAAYGLTRIDFRGKTFWFMLIFAGTIFPLQTVPDPALPRVHARRADQYPARHGPVLHRDLHPVPGAGAAQLHGRPARDGRGGADRRLVRVPHLPLDRAAQLLGANDRPVPHPVHLGVERPSCSMVPTSKEDVRSLMNGLMVLRAATPTPPRTW